MCKPVALDAIHNSITEHLTASTVGGTWGATIEIPRSPQPPVMVVGIHTPHARRAASHNYQRDIFLMRKIGLPRYLLGKLKEGMSSLVLCSIWSD